MEDEWECEEFYYDDDGTFGVGWPFQGVPGGGDVR